MDEGKNTTTHKCQLNKWGDNEKGIKRRNTTNQKQAKKKKKKRSHISNFFFLFFFDSQEQLLFLTCFPFSLSLFPFK